MGLPGLLRQIRDVGKMRVASDQKQVILAGQRCNPEIVFRQRATFTPQRCLDMLITARRFGITTQNPTTGDQLFNARTILLGSGRAEGALIELANDNVGNEDAVGFAQALQNGRFGGEESDHNVGVKPAVTTHAHLQFRSRLRWPAASISNRSQQLPAQNALVGWGCLGQTFW